jgi:hypothetical protein
MTAFTIRYRRRCSVGLMCAALVLIGSQARAWDSDDLARRASWQAPASDEVRQRVVDWLESLRLEPQLSAKLQASWQEPGGELTPAENLVRLVETARQVDPRVQELVDRCNGAWHPGVDPLVDVLQDEAQPVWLRANLRLYYAGWLAHHQLYQELHQIVADVALADVVDPAALLFFQGVGQHRRLDREACLTTLAKLLENETILPQRYAKLARLMQADLEPLKPDSLDEISRLMDNIHVTLNHGRAGKQVRTDEETVISKLDKLIKQLEDQANAAAAAAAGQAGGNPSGSAQPMQDSMPAELKGPGNVNPKELGTNTDWGNLPPKEREEALQQLGRDLPSHYRDVIEEYFRKLAREQEE